MITWPAIIKFVGDEELSFIGSQSDWESDADLNRYHYDQADLLIDTTGAIYSLTQLNNGVVTPEATGETIGLPTLTNLVRAHASGLGNCCVSKLGFYSIAEAVASVKGFNDFGVA